MLNQKPGTLEREESNLNRAENKGPDDGADDASITTRQESSANDHGGDDNQLDAQPPLRVDRVEAGRLNCADSTRSERRHGRTAQ